MFDNGLLNSSKKNLEPFERKITFLTIRLRKVEKNIYNYYLQRINFFTNRVFNERNGLPPEIIEASTLNQFKKDMLKNCNKVHFILLQTFFVQFVFEFHNTDYKSYKIMN
ncbi:hypothetical protein BpHYR1_043450 [Brachionus plicatilis]|uniref:Uncharacterized protein n=1 Tax=Brachionus plicatilis TaxID=10195 RepID=A0A3M7RNA0_BRAPC|nr:hypothetical protein BpHYR1_043450 [Brachionus plicatilis]